MSNWGNHLANLEQEHSRLDKQIDSLEKTGVFSDEHLETLKKQRLLIKDQIAIIKNKHNIN
jgi:uncharacterized protein YdcH (DUF465 family)